MEKTVSEKIAEYALSLTLEQVPPRVLAYGKLLLLDTIGVAMANLDQEHAQVVRRVVTEMNGNQGCTLWGEKRKVSLENAVLYNASLIHGSDYDDTHVGGIVHPSASVVSTAITVGEAAGSTGKEIFEAILAGWEIIVRLALAAKGRFHDIGYHGTGIVAPFAAACVAGKLLHVSEETLVNALGICGSQAAAIQEFLRDGSWVKKIHPGWGAHSAVYAVKLAQAGFTGPRKVFEGEFGLWKTHLGAADGFEVMDSLGKEWKTMEITFKLYPVCHMTHSFADCMFRARNEEHLTVEDISSVECRIEDRCYHIVCEPDQAKKFPATDYMMRFSLPYVAAVSFVKGKLGPREIDLRLVKDSRIREMMDKIQCVSDDSKKNPGYFPGWIRITCRDGREIVLDQRYEKGTAQNPVDLDAVMMKFNSNMEIHYPEDRIGKIASTLQSLEKQENKADLLGLSECR